MIRSFRSLANSASPLAIFASCLAGTLVFQAGPLIAALADLALWPLLPAAVANHTTARWLIRASALTVAALLGFTIPLLVAASGIEDESDSADRFFLAGGGPTRFGVIALVFGVQYIPVLTAPLGEEALMVAFGTVGVGILMWGWPRTPIATPRVSTAPRVRARVILGATITLLAVAVGTLLFAYSIDRAPGPPVTAGRAVSLLVLSPIILEFVYRGGVQRILAQRTGPVVAILGAGVCYALYHSHLGEFLEFMVFAVLVGVAYSVTESLLVAVAAHSMTNMGELFRDPLLDGFFNVYPTFGPTEGTVAAALSLILILAAARATKRLDL